MYTHEENITTTNILTSDVQGLTMLIFDVQEYKQAVTFVTDQDLTLSIL